ncbi:MAG TPA: hypothetical protein VMB03_06380 [Bryobacteraceae bacterium]|nr:hypothetical protein [Bryobacteraceae bacterium]
MEGKFTVDAGGNFTFGENIPPNNKSNDAPTLVQTFITQAGGLGIPAANFDAPAQNRLLLLFDPNGTDPNGQTTNLTTNTRTIRHALLMDGPYPDNSPCPPFSVEQRAANAMAAALPGPIGS